jgi:DENN domain-containing protein 5
LVLGTPLPPKGKINVELNLNDAIINFWRLSENKLPQNDFEYQQLFHLISYEDILYLFQAMLQEKQIIVTCTKYKILSNFINALITFLYPFSWVHVLIPILPYNCIQKFNIGLEILNAPVPFIIGCNTKVLKNSGFEIPNYVIHIDLNERKIMNPVEINFLEERDYSYFIKEFKLIFSQLENVMSFKYKSIK